MIATPTKPKTPTLIGEQRVVFHYLSWDRYLQILNALPQRRLARLTYDCGTLEITMSSTDHESALHLC